MFNSSGYSKKKVDAKHIMRLPRLDGVVPDMPKRTLSKEKINTMLEVANRINEK